MNSQNIFIPGLKRLKIQMLKKCPVCGRGFEDQSPAHNSKICSPGCRVEMRKKWLSNYKSIKEPKVKINCACCGKSFIPNTHNIKNCSKECSKISELQKYQEKKEFLKRRKMELKMQGAYLHY